MTVGRFAPSPTGILHIGNLRTALAAYESARASGGGFFIRFEDLDRVTSSRMHAAAQLKDLDELGIRSDSAPVFQSDRFDLYNRAIEDLVAMNRTYECFCSRREIREAAAAPHGGEVSYPGTCRHLTDDEREARRMNRAPALRLDSGGESFEFTDLIRGRVVGIADDVVLRRNDGVPAYNIAVVVDDAAQGVTEVVRGDDLVSITASQVALQKLLGLPSVVYGHVPLVVGGDGERLAKRHGAVTMNELVASGMSALEIRAMLWSSLGQDGETFEWEKIPTDPWEFRR